MSADRKPCGARRPGDQTPCGVMTDLRMNLQLHGPDGEWLRRPNGMAGLVSQAVCSRHKGFIEGRGLRGIDPEYMGEVVQ